jgi:7-carboxy-7-deazaguanine synthase
MSADVRVFEIFESIQGESSWAGLPCLFIRLAGCNLACVYCDTAEARTATGAICPVTDLVVRAQESRAALIEITGGEPLLQKGFRDLADALLAEVDKPLLVETNGSCDISAVPSGAVAIMDVKCPGSGESDAMDMANLDRLRPQDEVKFVLSDRADYRWASDRVRAVGLQRRCRAVFFVAAEGRLTARDLGGWIRADGLPVRLGVQWHKVWGVM